MSLWQKFTLISLTVFIVAVFFLVTPAPAKAACYMEDCEDVTAMVSGLFWGCGMPYWDPESKLWCAWAVGSAWASGEFCTSWGYCQDESFWIPLFGQTVCGFVGMVGVEYCGWMVGTMLRTREICDPNRYVGQCMPGSAWVDGSTSCGDCGSE